MKTLFIAFMLLASIKSNGQGFPNPMSRYFVYDTAHKFSRNYELFGLSTSPRSLTFQWGDKTSAYMNPKSDTLVVLDSVIHLYEHRIRYIKIKDKVYPLK